MPLPTMDPEELNRLYMAQSRDQFHITANEKRALRIVRRLHAILVEEGYETHDEWSQLRTLNAIARWLSDLDSKLFPHESYIALIRKLAPLTGRKGAQKEAITADWCIERVTIKDAPSLLMIPAPKDGGH